MKKLLFSISFICFIALYSAIGQVSTLPVAFSRTDLVTLTFDASNGDAGLVGYTGDVYAHIGVITDLSPTVTTWMHTKANWAINLPACKMVRTSNNIYTLVIGPDVAQFFGVPANEVIYKIVVVFRSSDGTRIGKNLSGADIFIPLAGVTIPHDGVTYLSDTSVKLTLTAPNKTSVNVIGSFNNWTADATNLMTKSGDKFTITINGLTKGVDYQYQYKIDNSVIVADPYTELVIDPDMDRWIPASVFPGLNLTPSVGDLARSRQSWFKTGQTAYAWQVTDFVAPKNEDLVVYELLIRDWQRASLNGSDRGIVKTLTDSIQYFKRLNINAIHIMPFNEFEGDDSWGYNPSFYFAPDKAYGPKNEYKRFIDVCHQNGIAVIMDLVLNHSFSQSPMAQMYWDVANSRPAANNPWYNTVAPHTCYGWGVDFNHKSAYTQKFVDDVTSYWLSEYNVDGFRFDFTKGFTQINGANCGNDYEQARVDILKRMANTIWTAKPGAYVILEHLAANSEEQVLAGSGMMLWSGVDLNTKYSEAVMGWNDGGSGVCKSDITSASYKNRSFSMPGLMAYMESHDEERLAFKGKSYGANKTMSDVLKRCGTAAAMYFTIPGPKLLWQFGERGYDVSIDSIGRTDAKPPKWADMASVDRQKLWAVYSNLINLKIHENAFRSTDFGIDGSNINGLKRIWINSAIDGNDVRVIANFGTTTQATQPFFSSTGIWYDHFAGTSFTVTDVNMSVSLTAGDFKLYSKKQMVGYGGGVPTSVSVDLNVAPLDVILYPQPCGDGINIQSSVGVVSVEVVDLQSVVLINESVDQESILLSTSALKPGLYLAKVMLSNGQVVVKKLIKK